MSVLESNFNAKPEDKNFRSLMPRVQIYDLNDNDYPDNSDTTKEKLKINISNKNPEIREIVKEGKCFDILFIKHDVRRPGFSSAIVKIDPVILNVIRSKQYRLFIDFSSCRVDNNIVPIQCFTCQGFNHKSNSPFCKFNNTDKKACLYCGGNHSSKGCATKKEKQSYKCINCTQAGLKNLCHSSTDKKCPCYQKQVEYLKNRTMGMEVLSKNCPTTHASTKPTL